tara:strand:- start:802 stop:2121 length:1320 start_codon:yes stop_codon:yes gene_type:complete
MIDAINNYKFKVANYSKETILSRFLLISEKIISFLLTAYLANKLSYSDIGFWSQAIYFAGLYTTLIGLNIGNGLISIVPRINKTKIRADLIFRSGLFLIILGIISIIFLLFFRDLISNLFFDNVLDLNIFLLILIIGFSEMMLDFVLFSFRSVKNFYFSNYVLFLKLLPRTFVFIGAYKNNILLMLYLYSFTFLFSCFLLLIKLYFSNKNSFSFFFEWKKNKLSLLGTKPFLKSLFIISKKSIFASLTAALFFFIARRLILSNIGLTGVGEFSVAILAGSTILFFTNFIGFTFYPYISNLAINKKKIAYAKTNKLSFLLILFSIIISLGLVGSKIVFRNTLSFYPFTINSIDLIFAFLGYGFLSAYQISQPFAFALTDDIKVIRIELISSVISFGLISLIFLVDGFSISKVMFSFCIYTFCNYLQAHSRNLKILKEQTA